MLKIEGLSHFKLGSASSGTYQAIINQVRPHDSFIVPFLGACDVVRVMNTPVRILASEINSDVVGLWQKAKLPTLQVFQLPAITFLRRLDFSTLGKAVVYLDVPYIEPKGRQSPEYPLSKEGHIELLEFILTGIPKTVDIIIRTEPHRLYENRLRGWRRLPLSEGTTNYQSREALFLNYPEPETLHDYQFLGKTAKERELFKSLLDRAKKRLENFSPLQQKAFLTALNQHLERIVEKKEKGYI